MIKLKIYGLGGQGVVTAAKVLSRAVSIHEDKYAITVPAYGHERRGAPVYTDVMIDEEKILLNNFVYDPDVVLILDETIAEKDIEVNKGITEDTILVINTINDQILDDYKNIYGFKNIYYVDGTKLAIENIGMGIPNGSMLGALARAGIVKIESIENALVETFGEKAGVKNAKAARSSYENTKKF